MFYGKYELDPEQKLFNVYYVDNQLGKLIEFSDLPFIKANDVNIELTKSHKDGDELTIDFKNYDDYQKIKKYYSQRYTFVFEMLLINGNGDYQQVELYFMSGYDEQYNGENEFSVAIQASDWKGFVEERRLIPHNVLTDNLDDNDFDKLRWTLGENVNDVFRECYRRTIFEGIEPSKGASVTKRESRQIPLLQDFQPQLKNLGWPHFIEDPMTLAELRKQWCDLQKQGIDWKEGLWEPKVHAYVTEQDKIIVDYYNQRLIKLDYKTNANNLISDINVKYNALERIDNQCVKSSEKDTYYWNELPDYGRGRYQLFTADGAIETNAPGKDGVYVLYPLATKAQQLIGKNSEELTISCKIELAEIPLLFFTPGDVIACYNMPLDELNTAFQIDTIKLASNHDNGYLEFSIENMVQRLNVWDYILNPPFPNGKKQQEQTEIEFIEI
nr:MAG TPA: hypothetical protein [Caudoviricetes sp.]